MVAELGALAVVESAEMKFRTELQSFVNGLGGEVLSTTGETLARDLF